VAAPAPIAGSHEIAFEAFGVRLVVETSDAEALDLVVANLPPGWRPCSPEGARPRFALLRELAGTYTLTRDEQALHQGLDLDLSIGLLDGQLRSELSTRTQDRVFVHAGAVAHAGRMLLLPGESFAGKTTLTAALVRLGATYYSDEFAVLDEDGLVHPYAKGLSLREDNGQMQRSDTPVERLGGAAGTEPLPVGLVAITQYRRDGAWAPRRLTPGEGVLALLAHTMPARTRPTSSLRALTRALSRGAGVLQGPRGDARELAPLLLDELARGG
jgi:hypothetical protein